MAATSSPHHPSQGLENLFERQERMVAYGPVFCDITWGAGGTTADVTLDIATRMQTQVSALALPVYRAMLSNRANVHLHAALLPCPCMA